jgi:hypothetical protein
VSTKDLRGADRLVVLEVLPAEVRFRQCAVATPVDEQDGLVEVALLAGGPGQLDERHLDLRVPADAGPSGRAERVADVVGGAAGDGEQVAVGAGPGVRDRGLQQVAGAVELVAVGEVAVARLLAGAAERGVEVAVGCLGRRDEVDQLDQVGVAVLVAGAARVPGHGLHELVDLGVGELPAAPDPHATGGLREVAGPAELVHPRAAVVDRRVAVDLLARAPEAADQVDLAETEGTQRALGGNNRAAAGRFDAR